MRETAGTGRRVLVTGATGCIGRHLTPALVARGWDVHALAHTQPKNPVPGVSWHQADLLSPDGATRQLRDLRPSHLVHLAWHLAPGRWASAPENVDWTCTSLALFQAFRAAGGTRLVAAGSCLEYDWSYGYCSESRTPCSPQTVYGSCKHALQLLTTAMAATGGMTTAWARIFFLYGPGEHPDRLVASVIRSILTGGPARCSHGRQVRDYLYAADVADALVALLESDVTGPVNVASGEPVQLRDIVSRIGELMERPDLIRLGAIPAATTDTPLVVADTSRLTSVLSWKPRVSIDAGLRSTIQWWRAELARPAVAAR